MLQINQKGITSLFILIAVITIILTAAAYYKLVLNKPENKNPNPSSSITTSPTPNPSPTPIYKKTLSYNSPTPKTNSSSPSTTSSTSPSSTNYSSSGSNSNQNTSVTPTPISLTTITSSTTPTIQHTTTPTQAPSKFVTVTYPNGGETFKVGDTVHITWSASSDFSRWSIGYSYGPNNLNWINAGLYSFSARSIDWVVPSNVALNTPPQIKIYVQGLNSATDYYSDQSDNFFTVNP